MRPRRPERGYALAALVAATAIMLILITVALPAWKYVVQNEREQELIFRGEQIAQAVELYQKKRGALPVSIDQLMEAKVLRKRYKDPMTPDGKWKLVLMVQTPPPGVKPPPPKQEGQRVGPFRGVSSTSTEDAIRLFNCEETTYDKWVFLAGQKNRYGVCDQGLPGQPPSPGASPAPSPTPK